MMVLEFLRSQALSLPSLAKFSIAMAAIVGVPWLCRRVGLPPAVGLLMCGVVLGPHGVELIGQNRPIADFFADLGKLLLMFFAGLEIDLARFRQAQQRTIIFGLLTTALPQLLGTAVGFLLGYGTLGAVVLGSLLASHTLLGAPIVTRLGIVRLEPITITFGATVMSDTLSLLVFAVCLATYKSGFSVSVLAIQVAEIAIFVPLVPRRVEPFDGISLGEARRSRGGIFHRDAHDRRGYRRLGAIYQSAGNCRGVSRWIGDRRGCSRQARKGEIGIHWQFLLHPDLLHRDRVFD
jgi:predicted Kef-type K+ transport protein